MFSYVMSYVMSLVVLCNFKNKATYLLQKPRKSNTYRLNFDKPSKRFSVVKCYVTRLSDFHNLTLPVLKVFQANQNLQSFNIENLISLIMHYLEQIFLRSYLFKMFSLENLKNLNTFPRKYLIFMPQ